MPKIFLSSQHDYVFGLSNYEFNNLCFEVENRKCVDRCGYFDFEELAKHYGRIPKCPKCGSAHTVHWKPADGCQECGGELENQGLYCLED